MNVRDTGTRSKIRREINGNKKKNLPPVSPWMYSHKNLLYLYITKVVWFSSQSYDDEFVYLVTKDQCF